MERIALLLTNDLAELTGVAERVEQLGKKYGWQSQVVFDIQLALEEVLVNVISYAYDDQDRHEIHLDFTIRDTEVSIQVTDDGKAFNPLEAPAPDLDRPIEERATGGLGIHLIRQIMDSLEYKREDNSNILTLQKNLTKGDGQ